MSENRCLIVLICFFIRSKSRLSKFGSRDFGFPTGKCFFPSSKGGWSDGAMVLGNFAVPGRPTVWIQ